MIFLSQFPIILFNQFTPIFIIFIQVQGTQGFRHRHRRWFLLDLAFPCLQNITQGGQWVGNWPVGESAQRIFVTIFLNGNYRPPTSLHPLNSSSRKPRRIIRILNWSKLQRGWHNNRTRLSCLIAIEVRNRLNAAQSFLLNNDAWIHSKWLRGCQIHREMFPKTSQRHDFLNTPPSLRARGIPTRTFARWTCPLANLLEICIYIFN